VIEFRVIPAADQQFGAVLQGRRATIRLRFNPTARRWSLDLAIDDQFVLHGRRIVTGVDLLRPFDFGIGRLYAMTASPDSKAEPGFTELHSGIVRLYHVSDAEITTYAALQS
jgi:hypothetical protein